MFDTEKTKAFFGLAAPFIEKFRQGCESERFDTPEAIAHTLSPLIDFGLWNLPGLHFADGRLLDADGHPMGRPDVGAHELLHDAIFRSEDSSMRYPLLNSDFSRGGITKLLMNVESGTFYPHPWLDPELLAQAKACREVTVDLVELHDKHDGDYRYGEHASAPLKVWVGLAYPVIERLVKFSALKRAGGVRFDTITAFLAPAEVTAKWALVRYPDNDRAAWVHFEHFVTMAIDELMPAPAALPPVTGELPMPVYASDFNKPDGANGNGHGGYGPGPHPSISMLASHFGEPLMHMHGRGDPLREAFERSQMAPKFEAHKVTPTASVSQIVVDTVALVSNLVGIGGLSAKDALDAAVKLLRPVAPDGEN